MTARRYVTPWWSHALSAVALLLIALLIFGPRALELAQAGQVGWHAAGAFVSLFLGVHRAVLAWRGWRARPVATKDSSHG